MNSKLLLLGVSLLSISIHYNNSVPATLIYNKMKTTHKLIERKIML